jgi:NhaA family Na+:H+ antiporter
VKLGVGRLPTGVNTRYVIGAGALAGIGFTVSLFVTELAFGEAIEGTDARLGVVIASLVAALLGAAICIPGKLIPDLSMQSSSTASELEAAAAH